MFIITVPSFFGQTPQSAFHHVQRKPGQYQPQFGMSCEPAAPENNGKRRVGHVPYSTALQRRRNEDLRTLRQEVQLLKDQLELLQKHRRDEETTRLLVSDSTNLTQSNWGRQACIELKKLQESKLINDELKTIREVQAQLGTAVRRVLRKNNVYQDVGFFLGYQPTTDQQRFPTDFNDVLVGSLSSSLERLHLEANMVFPALEDNLPVAFSSETKNDEMLGNYTEMNSITPMASTTQQDADILWHCITQSEDESCHYNGENSSNTPEMSCSVELSEGPLRMDGVCVFRRYDQGEQTILIGAMTFWLPNGGLHFETPYWTVISPSMTDPLHASVVQSCYKLQARATNDGAALLDPKYAHELVLNLLGNKMRTIMQDLQNALLSNVEHGPCQLEAY